jgi:hypothetical protein
VRPASANIRDCRLWIAGGEGPASERGRVRETLWVSDRLVDLLTAIDGINADDPTVVVVRSERLPLALAHGRLADEWVQRLGGPQVTAEVRIAARAHHLRRWAVPRSSYPPGRPGYLRWRLDQKNRHAHEVAQLMTDNGYGDSEVARVQSLIRRQHRETDVDAQLVEDAACLVFIETQLGDMTERIDRDQLVEVVRKAARKMSSTALHVASTLELPTSAQEVMHSALGGTPSRDDT